MAVYVEIQTDSFQNNLSEEKSKKRSTTMGVRRPYRGIEIKEDTYAVIKVIRADGQELPLTDAGGELKAQAAGASGAGSKTRSTVPASRRAATYNYSNFIIQNIVEAREEKSQIMETFGEPYIFFFGERPRMLQVTGLLMNTLDFNWRTEFWYNYEKTLRGTKLVENNARIYLYWDDLVVEGYMLGAQAQDNAEMPYHIPFSFNLFVTNHTYLSTIGSEDYPIRTAVSLQPLLTSTNVSAAMKKLKAQATAAEKYVSTTDAVRRSARAAARRAQLGQWLNNPKAMLTDTIQQGIADAGLGFINNVINFFYGRNLRFPRGLAGAESYAGTPQYVNRSGGWGFKPERVDPLRTKIRDNIDEYTSSGAPGWVGKMAYDLDYVYRMQQKEQNKNCYDMELKAVKTLGAMGLNVVQAPYGLAGPFSCEITNALDAITEDVEGALTEVFDSFGSGL